MYIFSRAAGPLCGGSLDMSTIRVSTVVESDGELHLGNLPFRKGDRVEAVVTGAGEGLDVREAARTRFLERAAKSKLCSDRPYPSRDDLHERD